MKKLLLSAIVSVALGSLWHLPALAQGSLWGTTRGGGTNGDGTVFRTNIDGTGLTSFANFSTTYNGSGPTARMLQASNGKLYGVTSLGGSNTEGALFEYDPSTGIYIKKFDFDAWGGVTGYHPNGGLVQASNGKLYGMTTEGPGATDAGMIFEYDITTGTYTNRFTFSGTNTANGAYPVTSLTLAGNGKYYSLIPGGTNFHGVLFEFDPAGGYTKKLELNAQGAQGWHYGTSDLVLAPNGKLYGTASDNQTAQGVLFEYDVTANTLTRLNPVGTSVDNASSIAISPSGKIYGVNAGIYEYDASKPTPFNQVYTSFGSAITDGNTQQGVMMASNGKLYGLARFGGTGYAPPYMANGILFEYNLTTGAFVAKVQFSSNAANPRGSLIQASDGMLYGVTSTPTGSIFRFNPGTGTITQQYILQQTSNGKGPATTIVKAVGGKFYGVTPLGGLNNTGTIFGIDPQADPNTFLGFNNQVSFARPGAAGNSGAYPAGGLTLASNNRLYAYDSKSGTNGFGTIFEWLVGSDFMAGATLTPKYYFTFDHAVAGDQCGFVAASNGKLYGMTSKGGTNNNGTIFEYNPSGSAYTSKFDFTAATTGNSPLGDLAEASNGKLYGMTYSGGANNLGVLFEYSPSTSTFVKKYDFSGASDGANPRGGVVQASNGLLYGMTSTGGSSGYGTLFQFDISTGTLTTIVHFNSTTNGANPYSSLMVSPNGKLYGTTYQGGANNLGVLFELDPATNTFTKKTDFNGTNGSNPSGKLYFDQLPKLAQVVNLAPIPTKLVTDPSFTVTATASSGLPVTYASSNPAVATIDASGNIAIVGYGATTITASQAGDATYYPNSIFRQLIVNRLTQTITFNPMPNGCVGYPYAMGATSSAGLAITYSSSDLTISSINNTDGTVFAIAPGNIVLTATQNGNATYAPATATQPFAMYDLPPVPTISASGPTSCVLGTVTLSAPSSTSYLWNTGATTSSITVGPGSYYVTVYNGAGCSRQSSTKNVTAGPPASITPGGATTFCAGGNVWLTANSGSGYTYLWSTGATSQSVNVSSTGNYTVTVYSGGCSTTSSPVGVTVDPTPSPSISGSSGGCSSVTLYASGGSSYQWLPYGQWGSSLTVTSSGSYSVNAYNQYGGCMVTSVPFNVTISSPITASISKTGSLCTSGVTLTASPGGASYSWSTGETSGSINVGSAGTYSVTVTSGYCSSSASKIVPTQTCGPCNKCRTQQDGTVVEPSVLSLTEIYPNPVDKELIIDLKEPVETRTSIRMLDAMGKVVHQIYIEPGDSRKSIITEFMSPGMYVVAIADDSNIATNTKVVINHNH